MQPYPAVLATRSGVWAWCVDVLGRRWRPSTKEYNDDDGTIHRMLSAAMRAAVLAVTALACDVDTQHV